jgi:hypothetical protein
MKFAVAALLALPAVAAFQAPQPAFTSTSRTSKLLLSSSSTVVVTGIDGKAASSYEEDLALTLQIIFDHDKRSTTVSKDQFVSQMQEVAKIEKEPENNAPVDVSIPYDAAAKLAYAAAAEQSSSSDQKMLAYADFKIKYEADAVALVKSKQPVDISIPYDAAAKNAYEASDKKKMAYAAFKTKYEADAVAMVKSKSSKNKPQPAKQAAPKAAAAAAPPPPPAAVDISIPYDAAAKLAFEASDKKMAYPDFKTKYEAGAVADVIAMQKK